MEQTKNSRFAETAKRISGALVIPVAVAVILLALCAIGGKSMISNQTALNNFIVYTAIVMITTMALSINLNSGRFDFSLGAMAILSAVIGSKITYAALAGGNGSALMMLVITLISGILIGLASGILYVLLRIPPIITSLGTTLIMEGVVYTITGGKYIMTEVQNDSMAAFGGSWVGPTLMIIIVLAVIIFLFDYTQFGYRYRALKEGQKVAAETGIREIPNALACYAICGGLMGLVGFLEAVRDTNIEGGNLSFGSISIMFTAFLPMFIGSYIGRYTNEKVGFLLAGLCMSMLNSTFAAFANEVSASTQSIINAVLLVVFLIYLNNENLIRGFFKPIRKKGA